MLPAGLAPAAAAETVTFAVAGPMSGPDSAAGQAMADAARLYAEQVNESGGLAGDELSIAVYDNARDQDLARSNAEEIGASDAVAVLGHYFSFQSLAAAPAYEAAGIPAITGSATAPGITAEHDTYFRVIADNDRKGRLAAQYLDSFLDRERVHIAYEGDAYGSTLRTALAEAAPEAGISVGQSWEITSGAEDLDEQLSRVVDDLRDAGPDDALFLGTLAGESARLVRRLRSAGIDIPILGGDSVGLGGFPATMREIAGEARAEELIDGIHATTYFIPDVGNRAARAFVEAFQERFGRQPDALAAAYYEAAAMAGEAYRRAMAGAGGGERDVADRRAALKDQLAQFDSPSNHYAGITGRIHFDEVGNAVTSAPFGVYRDGDLISAPGQLTPVPNPDTVIDLEERLAAGDIVQVDGQYLFETDIVYTGIDIASIDDIDQEDGVFTADFYLWLRHSRPFDHERIEFTNAAGDVELGERVIIDTQIGGTYYTAYRVTGEFTHSFDFRDYPVDSQQLPIRLRHPAHTRERLVFVADDAGMRANGALKSAEQAAREAEPGERTPVHDSEWRLGDLLVFSDIQETQSTLGNPLLIEAEGEETLSYSRFNVVAEVHRDPTSYILNHMVPLALFVLLGYVTMFIHPQGPAFVGRLSVAVTALLTTVFQSQRIADQLPDIGYLVAIDYIYYAVYAYFLVAITFTIAEHVALVRHSEAAYRRLDAQGRRVMLVLMAAVAVFAAVLFT